MSYFNPVFKLWFKQGSSIMIVKPFKSLLIYTFVSLSLFFLPVQFTSWKKKFRFFFLLFCSFHSPNFADSIPVVLAILKTHFLRCCPSFCHSLNIPLRVHFCCLNPLACDLLVGRGLSCSASVSASQQAECPHQGTTTTLGLLNESNDWRNYALFSLCLCHVHPWTHLAALHFVLRVFLFHTWLVSKHRISFMLVYKYRLSPYCPVMTLSTDQDS